MAPYLEKNAGISRSIIALTISPAIYVPIWGLFFPLNSARFWVVIFPIGLSLLVIPGSFLAWWGTRLQIDDDGIRFGDPSYKRPLRLGAITRAEYRIPWEGFQNPRILPRSRATVDLTIMSRISRQYNRSDRVVPGYIPSWGTHTLIFDVDITQAEPKAGQFRPLSGYRDLYGRYEGLKPRVSGVWCFPVRNRERVTAALEQRGFEVPVVKTYKGQEPKRVDHLNGGQIPPQSPYQQ